MRFFGQTSESLSNVLRPTPPTLKQRWGNTQGRFFDQRICSGCKDDYSGIRSTGKRAQAWPGRKGEAGQSLHHTP